MTPLTLCPKFRLLTPLACALLLSGSALAQGGQRDVDAAPVPVYAGTYHVATGVLSPPEEQVPLTPNPGVIYNNTCLPFGYFTSTFNGSTYIDEGRVPTTTSPSPNTGTQNTYWVTKYQIQYVTREPGPPSGVGPGATIRVRFWENYPSCTPLASAGATVSDLVLTGLPGSSAQGTAAGWNVDIDLTGGFEFCLHGDANGVFDGTDSFGYAYTFQGQAGGTSSATSGGPYLTGGTTCTAGASTYYKSPGAAPASGLDDLNQMRRDGGSGQSSGCFLFSAGGTFAYAGLWMKLTADLNNCGACPGNGPDTDGDGVPDTCDGCPNDPAKTAPGLCGCGVADTDTDSDGVPDCFDNCDNVANPSQTDTDGDGTGDACDGCPNDPAKTSPGQCGCGNPDVDADGDGYAACVDCNDNDPNVNPGHAEVCGNGIDDNCNGQVDENDIDTDGDGTPDCIDGCPNDPNKIAPGACGCGVSDADTDGDGTLDCNDGCPNDPNKIAPGACGCGVADVDTDGDGTLDCNDGCPNDPNKIAPGQCGCGIADTDSDSDGVANCNDGCPNDPAKIAPGQCGCGIADTDSDSDGTANCNDGCPSDPNKIAPGQCGCGVADTDSDGDGTANCNDGCPNDPAKIAPGVCGCGVADTDSDFDGVPNCIDNCSSVANPSQTDSDADGVGDACDNCPFIANSSQADCDNDGIGDACAIAGGAADCDANGIPDSCQLGGGNDQNANGIPDVCEQNGGTPYCFGSSNCPCGNNSLPAQNAGCKNSTGVGGKLVGSGSTSVSFDSLTLSATNLTGSIALFMQGSSVANANYFDGHRCIGNPLKRIGQKTPSGGNATYPQGADPAISTQGGVPAGGGARYYQVLYRNLTGPCGQRVNITNGVSVVWQP